MTSMLEKMSVAMAVCEMRRNGMSEGLCEAAAAHPATRAVALENYGPQARAALLAIRKADRDAVIAGNVAWTRAGSIPGVFTAMIDAILGDDKP